MKWYGTGARDQEIVVEQQRGGFRLEINGSIYNCDGDREVDEILEEQRCAPVDWYENMGTTFEEVLDGNTRYRIRPKQRPSKTEEDEIILGECRLLEKYLGDWAWLERSPFIFTASYLQRNVGVDMETRIPGVRLRILWFPEDGDFKIVAIYKDGGAIPQGLDMDWESPIQKRDVEKYIVPELEELLDAYYESEGDADYRQRNAVDADDVYIQIRFITAVRGDSLYIGDKEFWNAVNKTADEFNLVGSPTMVGEDPEGVTLKWEQTPVTSTGLKVILGLCDKVNKYSADYRRSMCTVFFFDGRGAMLRADEVEDAAMRPRARQQQKKEVMRFQVGDVVFIREDALALHSQTVPAHAGYTHEQFQYRDAIRDLTGATGVIKYVQSRSYVVEFPGYGAIDVYDYMIELT